MENKVTVFGLQRSGTNFLESFIRSNLLNIRICNQASSYIWKHNYDFDLDLLKDNHIHFLIHKHPISWVDSIIRYPVDTRKKWETLTKPGEVMNDSVNIIEAAKLWNDWHRWWFDLIDSGKVSCKVVRYETLIQSEKHTQDFLEEIISFHPKFERKTYSSPPTVPKKVSQSRDWSEDYRKKYLTLKTKHVKPNEREIILSNISDDILLRTKYHQDCLQGS